MTDAEPELVREQDGPILLVRLNRHRPDETQRNEAEVRDLFASGGIRPHIGATFTLDETAAALRYVADGRAIGKVVLDLRDAR